MINLHKILFLDNTPEIVKWITLYYKFVVAPNIKKVLKYDSNLKMFGSQYENELDMEWEPINTYDYVKTSCLEVGIKLSRFKPSMLEIING